MSDNEELFQASAASDQARKGLPGQLDAVSVMLGELISDVKALKAGQSALRDGIREAVRDSHEMLEHRLATVEAQSMTSAEQLATYRTTGRNVMVAVGLLSAGFGWVIVDWIHRVIDIVVSNWSGK